MPGPPTDATAALHVTQAQGPRHQPLVVVLVAASAGIMFDRFWPLPLGVWWMAAIAGVGLWGVFLVRHRPRWAIVSLLLAVATVAAGWHHCRWHLTADDDLGRFASRKSQPVCVEAVARTTPRQQATPAFDPMRMMAPGERSRMEIELLALRDGPGWRRISGRTTQFISGSPPAVQVGDRFRCFAELLAPRGQQNPDAFDYATYLRSSGIWSSLRTDSPECISVIERGTWLNPRRILDQVRAHGNRLFEDYLNPRYAEMAEAVLLGERDQLESERVETFMATGTIHLLVISGLNLGILAGAMYWVIHRTRLPRGWVLLAVVLVTVLYTLLVDSGPPVVRATVVVVTACVAAQLGREPLGLNSLAVAALVVLGLNPNHLFHVGAQLSFLCVAGLIWFAPLWYANDCRRGRDDDTPKPRRGWPTRTAVTVSCTIWQAVLISTMLWLLTMPLVMARFHLWTPIAAVVNAVVWLPMACATVSGFALLVVGGISPLLAYPCGLFCNANLWLLEWCVDRAREIPCSHYWLPGPADWWLIGFYGGLGVLAAFPRIRPRRIWCAAVLLGWIAVGFLPAAWRHHPEMFDCTFVAMGHGCAVVLALPSGQTMLYDAGQFGAPSAGVRALSGVLWSRGIHRLDAVFLSHADVDHYNALPGLLERFSVGAVYVSPTMFQGGGQAITALRAIVDRHGVPIHAIQAGDRLSGGEGCTIEVLHPQQQESAASTNANSLVLQVDFQQRRVLLPGDLESPGLQELLAAQPRHCEVLMAPHHGSRQSNSPDLARWCTPAWVIFSDDGRWNLPEIDATYQAVGSRVLHTNDAGAIQVRISGKGVQVTPFVEPREYEPVKEQPVQFQGSRHTPCAANCAWSVPATLLR